MPPLPTAVYSRAAPEISAAARALSIGSCVTPPGKRAACRRKFERAATMTARSYQLGEAASLPARAAPANESQLPPGYCLGRSNCTTGYGSPPITVIWIKTPTLTQAVLVPSFVQVPARRHRLFRTEIASSS